MITMTVMMITMMMVPGIISCNILQAVSFKGGQSYLMMMMIMMVMTMMMMIVMMMMMMMIPGPVRPLLLSVSLLLLSLIGLFE